MKNKIIKIICFSLLALSVALCAVFTLPKKDNLKVNAQESISPSMAFDTVSIPFDTVIVEYIADGNVQTWGYFPLNLTFQRVLGVEAFNFGYYSYDFFSDYFGFAVLGQMDNLDLTVSIQGTGVNSLSYELTAHNFYFDLTEYSSDNPLVTYQAMLQDSSVFVPLADYSVTVDYIVPTPGLEATVQTAYAGANSLQGNYPLFEVFNADAFSNLDFSIIYIVSFELFINYYNLEDVSTYQQTAVQISDFPYSYNVQDTYATRFLNQWDSNREVIIHEYQVDFFASIVSSVDSFMKTEFLPNVSFYDLLLFCIVIPLVVVVLKMWLGG